LILRFQSQFGSEDRKKIGNVAQTQFI